MTFAAAYAKERDLKAFDSATASVTCTFRTIDQLFPDQTFSDNNSGDYPEPIIQEGKVEGRVPSDDGVNYYGGFYTYIDIPTHNADGYHYFVTHDNRGVSSNVFAEVASTGKASLYTHICDSPDTGCDAAYSNYLDELVTAPATWRHDDPLMSASAAELAGSHDINLIEHVPSLQSLGSGNLHGAISCTESSIKDNQYVPSAQSNHKVTGSSPTCSLTGFEKTWYFGVQSKCQGAKAGITAEANKIFAWYVYEEEARTITVTVSATDSTALDVDLTDHAYTEKDDETPEEPAQILFASPAVLATRSTGLTSAGFEEFSSVKSITSSVQFEYTNQHASESMGTATPTTTAPKRCSLNPEAARTDLTAGGVQDAAGAMIDDSFSVQCKASATAEMVVNFRDAPSDEQCASPHTKRVAQIEFSLVQFVRIHETLTLPSIKNNTAQQFHLSEDAGQWSCLNQDNCVKGDPYKILKHKVETMNAQDHCDTPEQDLDGNTVLTNDGNDGCEATLQLTIAAQPLQNPQDLNTDETPWSYVMGIADFSISDCGTDNFVDHVERDEYPARRLGASVSKPGARHTQLHYGSYKGY